VEPPADRMVRVQLSHVLAGDVVDAWLPSLVSLMFVIVSWALRPADRRLPIAGLAPDPVLSLGPFRSGSSFFCLSFRISRCPRSTLPSTNGHVISAGLPAESDDGGDALAIRKSDEPRACLGCRRRSAGPPNLEEMPVRSCGGCLAVDDQHLELRERL